MPHTMTKLTLLLSTPLDHYAKALNSGTTVKPQPRSFQKQQQIAMQSMLFITMTLRGARDTIAKPGTRCLHAVTLGNAVWAVPCPCSG
eukprot:scaffold231397_cov18-Tisochrysis_lutea.AAC.1